MRFRFAPQITIRTLLIVIGCFALIFAAYSARAHRQKKTVSDIEALGGSVVYGPSIFVDAERFLPMDFVASVEEVACNRLDADGGHFVFDMRLMIPCLKRLSGLKRVLIFEINHRVHVPALKRALPGVEIVVQDDGVVG